MPVDEQIDYHITVGDFGKILTATLRDAHHLPVDLSDATSIMIRCAKNVIDTPLFVAACDADPDQTINTGVITYTFTEGQTDTPGYYKAQIVVTWPNKRVTFPTKALVFEITAELQTA